MTSATLAEVNAFCINSIRRRFKDLNDLSACKILLLLYQSDTHPLPRQAKWDKDGAAVVKPSLRVILFVSCPEVTDPSNSAFILTETARQGK